MQFVILTNYPPFAATDNIVVILVLFVIVSSLVEEKEALPHWRCSLIQSQN
jgi:hypothetical protein